MGSILEVYFPTLLLVSFLGEVGRGFAEKQLTSGVLGTAAARRLGMLLWRGLWHRRVRI